MRLLIATIAALAALALAPAAFAAGPELLIGASEDGAQQPSLALAKAQMDLAKLAGFNAVRLTALWDRGLTAQAVDAAARLKNAIDAADLDGIHPLVSIYPRGSSQTPLTDAQRADFAAFAASVLKANPSVHEVIVGNEPNLNRFWMPQFGLGGVDLAAPSYELLLAKTYDALKSVSPDVNVIGGALSPHGQDDAAAARQTHSPTEFIRDLGAAYRKTGRRLPIMDMFAIHPYLIPSSLPPSFAHPKTTSIGIADYPKLVRLLTHAFAHTAQRGETLPIIYDEFGYQSQIPARKQPLYTHLKAPGAKDAISEALQATYYRQAFALAACQPTVAGLLIFHVVDERDARAWQSGVYYSNATPKSSLAGVRDGALAAQTGTLSRCAKSKTTDNLSGVAFHEPSTVAPTTLDLDFSCALPCSYQVQIVDAQTGEIVADAAGKAVGRQTVTVPADGLDAGSYQYALRVLKCGKPGTEEARYSRPFAVTTAPPDASAGPPPDAPPPDLPGPPLLPAARSPLPTLLPTVPPAA
jgi:hypothetical protein